MWLKSAPFEVRAYRSIKRRVVQAYADLQLRRMGVKFKGRVSFCGMPLVSVVPNSRLELGHLVSLVSWPEYNPIGVNHRVILRTLTPHAELILEDQVGISGATVCAATRVHIGAGTLIGANALIMDTNCHSLRPAAGSFRHSLDFSDASQIMIGRNVFVGAGAIILRGVNIGDNAVIGAGSVVTKAIPPDVVAAGNPCIVIRQLPHVDLLSSRLELENDKSVVNPHRSR